MLIYCSRIALVPKSPLQELLAVAGDWLRFKTGQAFTPTELAGEGERTNIDGSSVQWLGAEHDGASWNGIRYSHPDRETRGREWLTEIGVYRTPSRFACSVLLRTHEKSALVDPNVQTTRPRLVADIFERCQVASDTGGGRPRTLRVGDAEAFLSEVNDPERVYPLVQVCHAQDGTYLVSPDRLASQLAGVATVVAIPPDVDTFELADALTPRLCCYHGAVNIVWPKVMSRSGPVAPNFRVLAHQIEEVRARGGSPESRLLATVCHRVNEVFARDHISPEMVRSAKHRAALAEARKAGPKGDPELEALARQVDVDQRAEIDQLRADIKSRDNEIASLRGDLEESEQANEALKLSLNRISMKSTASSSTSLSDEVRGAMTKAMSDDAVLVDGLKVISLVFPERIVILDSAWKSARDASEFKGPRRAFELLHRLCTGYWDALATGGSDGEARAIFGNAFSAKESETVESNKRAQALRTFVYKGKPHEMMMHLRIGNKPSVAETFRAHFEWDADSKKVVLGHCGKHLDHK
ncbi:MAG: hypothetical protein KF805_16350 [Phycisphaeraceae bacterium]|nr:hypothetical protein [Phycisphaeraceae bacterium]